MVSVRENFICFRCKHYRPVSGGCNAFDGDIPNVIALTNKHNKPLQEQKNKIVFEEGQSEEDKSFD